MKIKELEVNAIVDIQLVVKSATARKTKAGKPFLSLELFDGTSTILGQYWEWLTNNIPAPNTILDIKAQVTEWQGSLQLNISSMTTSTTASLVDFAPTSDAFNIEDTYNAAVQLMDDVEDDTLRTIALAVLKELRQAWLTVPGATSVHHNFVGGTLVHSYDVAVKAKALAEATTQADVSLATVGGMLHDLGKLFTYKLNGVAIDRTADGNLYEHLFIGAEFLGNFAESHLDTDNPYVYHKIRLLRHIILAHHGQLEFGSPVTPKCIEAYIVHYADSVDAINEQLRVASAATPDSAIWTDKIWTLNNQPHLTKKYVSDIMLVKTGE